MSERGAMRVLVTGASGFVGGALLRRLRREPGIEALGIGRRTLAASDYRSLDLTAPDASAQLDALRWPATPDEGGYDEGGQDERSYGEGGDGEGGADVIVHAAARSSPWGTRREFELENVEATRTVLEHAERLARRPRVIFVSTASVLYRAGDQLDVADDAPSGRPFVNAYAASKHAAEQLVRGYGGEWVVLRPRAVFGVGDTTLFPRIVTAARAGRLPRLRARGGRPVLSDLVPVETLAEYLLRACREPAVVGRKLTVTGGEAVELQPVVLRMLESAGVDAPAREVPRAVALAAATLVEAAWRVTRRRTEPPITRYSVIVYAFSKTFDGRAAHRLLGPPPVTVHAALDTFAASLAPPAPLTPPTSAAPGASEGAA